MVEDIMSTTEYQSIQSAWEAESQAQYVTDFSSDLGAAW